ncbi:uncharacterized protein Tco025E_02593 [Trypanosoma conorhini]|uniref:Uncharacterized protein n=1 Tax=Trypanosoma conorhini TaxID=83891 RepID=A0A422Q284_9TRYP|nr:uncharacterized protein Tco025E_02593 [Trypanosoma conorhini]RNF24074.1 hypothetical protein Tco025E_02593 [Trypanosoma conorhini]
MKLLILGGPVPGKVHVDITPDKPFGEVFALIQEAIDKGSLWDKFQLYMAEVHDQKVRTTARVIQSTDTAASLALPSSGAVVVLRPLHPPPSAGSKAGLTNADAASTPQTSARGDYRSRMIAMYQRYEPSKLGSVDASLLKFKGREEAVIRQLVKKYGPEPDSAAKRDEFPLTPVEVAVPEPGALFHASNDAPSYHDRLLAIYQTYAPSKVRTVRATLEKFKGREEAVIRQLVKKYGPEPPVKANTPLSPTSNPRPISLAIPASTSAVGVAAAASPVAASTPQTSTRGDYRSRMIAMYQRYEPSKLGSVDASLLKFKGREEAVIRQLVKKYGPEPDSVDDDSLRSPLDNNNSASPAPATAFPVSPEVELDEKAPMSASNKLESADGLPDGAAPPASTSPSAFNENVSSEPPPQATLPPASSPLLKDSNELQLESYGFQAFISPTEQDPLVEPLSEADINSTVEEAEPVTARENKRTSLPSNLSFSTATAIMAKEKFDTTWPMLRDLERSPPLKQQNHIQPLDEGHVPNFANTRLQGVRKRALEALSGATAKQLGRVYWRKWQYRVAQKVANDLLKEKVWVKTHDGARLVDTLPHGLDVPNLEEYVYYNRICAGRRSVDFSDDVQKALRELIYTAKQHLMETSDRAETPFFSDQDLCPVRDTRELAAFLRVLRNLIFDFTEAKSLVTLRQREVLKLTDANECLQGRLGKAETSLSHLAQVEAELTLVQARCDKLNEKLGQAREGWTSARYQLQFLRRELKKERNHTPTNTEELLRQKDDELASVQRELAKLRSKLHREVRERESLESQLKDVRAEAVRTAQKLEKLSSSGKLVGRDRPVGVGASRLNLPRRAFPSGFAHMLKTEQIWGEDFLPQGVAEATEVDIPLEAKTNKDLVRENIRLEVELRELEAAPEEVEFGQCPHCRMRLTPCSAAPTGPPGDKAAFCFSCRRSYTFGDLMARGKSPPGRSVKRVRDVSLEGFAGIK